MSPVTLLSIVAYRHQRLARVPLLGPTLIAVQEGHKRLLTTNGEIVCHTGQWIALPGGQEVELINQPADGGCYRALCLGQPRPWLERFLLHWGERLPAPPWPGETIFTPDERALQALADLQALPAMSNDALADAHAEHVWQGLMLTLAAQRQAWPLFAPPRQGTREQVLALFTFDPGRDWNPREVASRLAMSEATLRRRLAAQSTSFSALLADARMERALALINGSRQPLGDIAHTCGYQSPSRFAAAFRRRFGLTPSALRATG